MTDHVDVPIVATGDWIDAAWINQFIGDNNRAWQQAYTAAGMMAYALDANTLAGLTAPTVLSLFQHNGSVPSYLAKGSAYQHFRMNAAGDGFEFGNTLLTKLGGSGNVAFAVGTPILWTTEQADDGSWHSLVSATSRITVPVAGRYRPSGVLGLWTPTGGATVPYLTSVRVNGVSQWLNRKAMYQDGTMGTMEIPSVPLILNANDYVEIFYDGGGTVGMSSSFFSLERIP